MESNRFLEIFSAAHALHPTDMIALNLIMFTGTPMTPGALAKALNLSASATTSVLDRLEKAGHVTATAVLPTAGVSNCASSPRPRRWPWRSSSRWPAN